jgi:hypothetical protein
MRFAGHRLGLALLCVVIAAVAVGCGEGAGTTTSSTAPPVTTTTVPSTTTAAPTTSTVPPTTAATTTTTAATTTSVASGPPTPSEVVGFREWLKMNLEPVEGRTHGLTNIYINQTRAAIAPSGQLTFPFPYGTVVVKEGLSDGLVSIMRKTKGADPAHDDWQWAEYRPDGTIVGKDDACWTCHTNAKAKDWVFTALAAP